MATNEKKDWKTCSASRAIQAKRVFPGDLNVFATLFGGQIMAMIDETSSISISRHCRRGAVTGAVDTIQFHQPLKENQVACVETYVTGAGTKSMEVFAKVLGEDLATGERFLAVTCFMTFVAIPSKMNPETTFQVPAVRPETDEEKAVCAGYQTRQAIRAQVRTEQAAWLSAIDQRRTM